MTVRSRVYSTPISRLTVELGHWLLRELWTAKARRLIDEVCFFLLTEVMQRQSQSLALTYVVRLLSPCVLSLTDRTQRSN